MAFSEKPPKLVDLLEISNFLCKVPCTRVLTQFLAKCMAFVEKPPKLVFSLKIMTFRAKYHVLGFWPNFYQNMRENMVFRENLLKFVDPLKTSILLCKVPCGRVSTKVLAKCCKKYRVPWKTIKTCPSLQN